MIYATAWEVLLYLRGQKVGPSTEKLTELDFRNFCVRASRRFDTYTHRHFYPKRQTRTYNHPAPGGFYEAADLNPGNFLYPGQNVFQLENLLKLDDDLMELLTLTTNNGGTVITSSDYFLMTGDNYNLPPYDRICLKSDGTQTVFLFSGTPQAANTVLGVWGYHEQPSEAWAQLDAVQDNPLLTGSSTITVVDPDGVDEFGVTPRFYPQQQIRIGSGSTFEYCLITDVNFDGTTIEVARGIAGTTAMEWVQDSLIYVYRPMPAIVDAVLTLASHLWRRKDSIGTFEDRGMASSTGVLVLPPKLPLEVADMIQAYIRSWP